MRTFKRILFVVSPFVTIIVLFYIIDWLMDRFGIAAVVNFSMMAILAVFAIAVIGLVIQTAWEASEKFFPKKNKGD